MSWSATATPIYFAHFKLTFPSGNCVGLHQIWHDFTGDKGNRRNPPFRHDKTSITNSDSLLTEVSLLCFMRAVSGSSASLTAVWWSRVWALQNSSLLCSSDFTMIVGTMCWSRSAFCFVISKAWLAWNGICVLRAKAGRGEGSRWPRQWWGCHLRHMGTLWGCTFD